ncbi:MAG: hypothetical protein NTZ84_00680 [Candidatus Nealsonbacteria bacterium]|nr:hypothetical protein [Candidatus Nealsonbacteria bacterium]
MAIVFAQQNKKQKVLIFILVAILITTAVVLWFGFFGKNKTGSEAYIAENAEVSQEEIKIEFSVLKNPLLKELQPFSEIQPLEQSTSTGSKGRENPFLPY